MNHHTSTWKFIDRDTYSALRQQQRPVDLSDFANMQDPKGVIAQRLSASSYEHLVLLNHKVTYTLFGDTLDAVPSSSHPESQCLLEQVKSYLQTPCNEGDTFYEILTVDSKTFVVVVESGFLHFLTQSKETLSQYLLTCLGHLDRFKCESSHLNRQYLRLSFIEGHHLLVKARAQS